VGSDTDNAVLQIATAYEVRGLIETVTSTNSATAGSGTVVNQVALAYNTFSELTEEQQSHSGAVGGSTPSVQYAYDTGGSSSNEIRLNQLTYPNGRAVSYNFASGMDSILNRITSISDTIATLAEYTYLGAGTVVRITYAQPSVWLDLWGGTSGTFNGLDQFNRIIDQRWQNSITGTPADIDRYKYGYDLNSNRQWKQNVVSSAASVPLDEYYDYDNLNRLTEMQRGTLTGGPPFTGIGGTPVAEQDWTLDPTGNWSGFVTKASGTTTLNQTRTQNTVNEITAIGGTPSWATPPAYDAAGNMNSFPQPASPTSAFTAIYDAWNRMVSISSGGSSVATYQYDGRNFRIVKYTASIPETRHFYYTNQWQDIEERVGTATTMDKQYVWGIRYVDELACRDDATPQRLYACQDANFNLTAITDTSGNVVERYVFDPYGTRAIYDGSWTPQSASTYAWVIGHQGLMHDMESGLVYNRERYVQPLLGMFLRRDPIGYANGGANSFVIMTPEDQVIASRARELLREFTVLAAQGVASRGTMVAKLNEARRFVETAYGIDRESFVATTALSLYEYEVGNPLEYIDPRGLKGAIFPKGPGGGLPGCGTPGLQDNICSLGPPGNLLNCFGPTKECCKNHDRCYAAHQCTAGSWIFPWCPRFLVCESCNARAVACIATAGLLGPLDPNYGKPVAPSTQPKKGDECPIPCGQTT
jgi:RHS repeat-associated protein